MPALWTYPWNLAAEGPDAACEVIAAHGIDAINLASHYHSVRSMNPRTPENLFERHSGGCYFDLDEIEFDDTPIDPQPVAVDGMDDPLAELVGTAAEHGLDVNAWTVCLHNTVLGAANPEYRIESAFGDAHDHAFCPSHPTVRDYFADVVTAISDRGVAEIQLESVGFQSAFHEHGAEFGHDKRQTLTTMAEEVLVSQCFCDGCRNAARDHPVDMEAARETVRRMVRNSFDHPDEEPPSLDTLADENEILGELFNFRAEVVTEFVDGLATAAEVPLNYYAMEAHTGVEPGSGWPAGVELSRLEPSLDRITAICYVTDPSVARERIRTFQRTVDLPVDVGVTLDPSIIEREEQLHDLVDAIRDETDDDIFVYHHGLMTETQLEWVASAFAAE
jgi:hypothetical protein